MKSSTIKSRCGAFRKNIDAAIATMAHVDAMRLFPPGSPFGRSRLNLAFHCENEIAARANAGGSAEDLSFDDAGGGGGVERGGGGGE